MGLGKMAVGRPGGGVFAVRGSCWRSGEARGAGAGGELSVSGTGRRRSSNVGLGVNFGSATGLQTRLPATTAPGPAMNILARFSLFWVAVIVAGGSLGWKQSLADELPTDTNKIESLTPEQARKLVKEFPEFEVDVELENDGFYIRGHIFSHGLPLNGLTTIDAETSKALAQFKGNALLLAGLTSLDADAAKAFKEYRGAVWLKGLLTISDDTAKALSQHEGDLYLTALTTLSEDAAEALSQHNGELYLNALTTLSEEASKSLAQHKGVLPLSGLAAISGSVARGLSQYKGESLSLHGLATLSDEAAKALAAAEKWDGELLRLTAIDSVAVAKALATRKGPLKLPNLKKISPKMLTTLIEKRDVEIPLVETLELIPEPDGSATEDFVIPEWLEERQRQQRGAQAAE